MIEIPIYHHDEHSKQLEELGIHGSIADAPTEPMLFVTIAAIGHYKDDDIRCGLIHANGMSFVTPWSYEELKMKLYGAKGNLHLTGESR